MLSPAYSSIEINMYTFLLLSEHKVICGEWSSINCFTKCFGTQKILMNFLLLNVFIALARLFNPHDAFAFSSNSSSSPPLIYQNSPFLVYGCMLSCISRHFKFCIFSSGGAATICNHYSGKPDKAVAHQLLQNLERVK